MGGGRLLDSSSSGETSTAHRKGTGSLRGANKKNPCHKGTSNYKAASRGHTFVSFSHVISLQNFTQEKQERHKMVAKQYK